MFPKNSFLRQCHRKMLGFVCVCGGEGAGKLHADSERCSHSCLLGIFFKGAAVLPSSQPGSYATVRCSIFISVTQSHWHRFEGTKLKPVITHVQAYTHGHTPKHQDQ